MGLGLLPSRGKLELRMATITKETFSPEVEEYLQRPP